MRWAMCTSAVSNPEDKEYDAFNTGRLLHAVRFLPYINKEKELNTTFTNPYYN